MQKVVLAAVFLISAASAASAADLRTPAHVAPAPAAYDWTGLYVGASVGYGWGKSKFTDADYNGLMPKYDNVHWDATSNGIQGDVRVGYNLQKGNVVFGLEGVLGYLNLRGHTMQPGADRYGLPYDAAGTMKGGLYGMASLRLGYAIDRTLIYVKGGAVYSGVRAGIYDGCTVYPCGDTMVKASKRLGWGYQVGAGVEHAIDQNWTIRAEYTFMDFGKTTVHATGVGGSWAGVVFPFPARTQAHVVNVGVNYRF